MPRLIPNTDAVEALYGFYAQRAVDEFNATGELPPSLTLLAWESDPAKALPSCVVPMEPDLVAKMHANDTAKDLLMQFVRQVLDSDVQVSGGADQPQIGAVVHVAEALAAVQGGGPYPAGGLAEHPNRRTVLLVAIHTPARTYMQFCPVAEEGDTKRAVFRPFDRGAEVRGGRMDLGVSPEDQPVH